MPNHRNQIKMTEVEQRDLLESCPSLHVATLNGDGTPHLTTVHFGIVDGQIVFETFSKSQKVVNLRRNPRIAVLAEAGTDYTELRGVSINGTADLVDDPALVRTFAVVIIQRNHEALSAELVEERAERMAVKRSVVLVKPDKVMSWDHRKLQNVEATARVSDDLL